MSFYITGEDESPHVILSLRAIETIRVPPLGLARIPHGFQVLSVEDGYRVYLERAPRAWAEYSLFVDQGPVDLLQDVATNVFNFTNFTVRVPVGMVLSHLVCLKIG